MIYQKTDLWTSITDKRNTIFRYGIIFNYLKNTVPNSTLSFINGIFDQLQFFVLREPMPRLLAHEAMSMIGFHGLERVEPDMCKLSYLKIPWNKKKKLSFETSLMNRIPTYGYKTWLITTYVSPWKIHMAFFWRDPLEVTMVIDRITHPINAQMIYRIDKFTLFKHPVW